MPDLAVALVAFAVTAVTTPIAIVVARRTGIVDRPGALKVQSASVPYLGGAAVLCGTAVGAAVARPVVLVPLVGATALGVADDRFDLPARLRLAGQLLIGIAIALTVPDLHLHMPAVVAAVGVVVATVLLINGVNLIDGLDMLASGVVAVSAAAFAVVGIARPLSLAVAASLVGFLLYNRPPARIYLGDGGAYLLGASLAVLVADSWGPAHPAATGVASLALVAVPVAEVAVSVIRRARAGGSLLAGDRGHPYDRLVARGWPRPAAALSYAGAQALVATGAVIAARRGSLAGAVAADAGAAVVLLLGAAMTGALTPDKDART